MGKILIVDVDGDGKDDLVCAVDGETQLSYIPMTGKGCKCPCIP